MKKLREDIDYGGRRERMDPELERKLRAGENVYSTNPAMKKGSQDVQRLVSSRFNKVVDKLKEVTGIQDLSSRQVQGMLFQEMMGQVPSILRIEGRHREKLSELAVKACLDETEVPEGWFDIQVFLNTEPIDVSNFRYEPEDEKEDEENKEKLELPSFDIEDLTDEELLELEKHKRNIINALIQGAAKKGHYVFQKPEVKAELDKIDSSLYPAYLKIMAINDFMYFTMEQMIEAMSQTGQGVAGKVELESSGEEEGGEGGEEKPDTVIKAYGLMFPIVCHEIIKGVEEALGRHGLPQDTELAQKVMGQTDILSAEPMQLRIGPEIVEKLRMALPDEMFESLNKGLINWFKISLYKIEPKEFLMVIGDAISNDESKNKKATARFQEIMAEAQRLKQEYEDYQSEKGQDSDDDDIDDDDLDDFLGSLGITRK